MLVSSVIALRAVDSKPYRSRRVIDCSGLAFSDIESSSFCSSVDKTFAMLVMPSHSSQPSQALPLIPFPRIISAKISATRARRHPFLRSSMGSRTARTPCTSSWRHADSFSRCSMTVDGTDSSGTGESAGCGLKVWCIKRGSRASECEEEARCFARRMASVS